MLSARFVYRVAKDLHGEIGIDSLERLAGVSSGLLDATKKANTLEGVEVKYLWWDFQRRGAPSETDYVNFQVDLQAEGNVFNTVTSIFLSNVGVPSSIHLRKGTYRRINNQLKPYGKRIQTHNESAGGDGRRVMDL